MLAFFAFLLIFGLPIGIIGGILAYVFFHKTRKCPVCSEKVNFMPYMRGITCRVCKTRLLIKNSELTAVSR